MIIKRYHWLIVGPNNNNVLENEKFKYLFKVMNSINQEWVKIDGSTNYMQGHIHLYKGQDLDIIYNVVRFDKGLVERTKKGCTLFH